MNIQKATMPLKDGETYYMPIVFIASQSPIQEGGGCFLSPSGNLIMLNRKTVSELMESPTTPILKCKDCKHADLFGSRFATCKYTSVTCFERFSKPCKHFEARKEQSNG